MSQISPEYLHNPRQRTELCCGSPIRSVLRVETGIFSEASGDKMRKIVKVVVLCGLLMVSLTGPIAGKDVMVGPVSIRNWSCRPIFASRIRSDRPIVSTLPNRLLSWLSPASSF